TAGTPAKSCVWTNACEMRNTVFPAAHPSAEPLSVTTCPRWTVAGVTVSVGEEPSAVPAQIPAASAPATSARLIAVKGTGLPQQAREAPVLEDAAAGLTGRAVVDGVLLVVHLRDRSRAVRTRRAEPVVHEVDVAVVLPALAQLE